MCASTLFAVAAGLTGIDAGEIAALARLYVGTRPAMIVPGGSSMHKGDNGWQASRPSPARPD